MRFKTAEKFFVGALYALSLSIFLSISLVSVFHILLILSFSTLLVTKKLNVSFLPKSLWVLLAFILSQLLSAIWNFEGLEETAHSMGIVKYPLIGAIGVLLFRSLSDSDQLQKHLRISFNFFLGSILFAFFYGVIKVYGGYDLLSMSSGSFGTRLSGFTDIMRYGYISALVLLGLICLYLNRKRFSFLNSRYLLVTLIICFMGLLLSYTRGALLGLLVALPVSVYFYNKRYGKITAAISTILVLGLITIALMGGSQTSRFFMSAMSSSNTIRISQYQTAWKAFLEKPLLGYGPQQLRYHVKEIKDRYDISHKEYINEHSHNIFLEALANTGLIGFTFFILWLFTWLIETTRLNSIGRQLFIPALVFIFVAGQFEMLLTSQMYTLIYFLYSLTALPLFKKPIQ